MKIHIKNGRLVDPQNGVDAVRDLYVAAGKIAGVGSRPGGFTPNRVIDATGLVVCPGLVDLAARLREPGFEYKATLESEMRAAVAGGVTSLACPPDTDPPLDEPGLVEMLKYKAKILNQAHVYPVGAQGRAPDRDGGTSRCGLHRIQPRRRTPHRYPGADARFAVRGDVRLFGMVEAGGCLSCSPGRRP